MGKASRAKVQRRLEAQESPTMQTVVECLWSSMGSSLSRHKLRFSQFTLQQIKHHVMDRLSQSSLTSLSITEIHRQALLSGAQRQAAATDVEITKTLGHLLLSWASTTGVPAAVEMAIRAATADSTMFLCIETALCDPEVWRPLSLRQGTLACPPEQEAGVIQSAVELADGNNLWVLGCLFLASAVMVTRSAAEMTRQPQFAGEQTLNPWGWNPVDEHLWSTQLPADGRWDSELMRPFMRQLARRVRLSDQVVQTHWSSRHPVGAVGAVYTEHALLIQLVTSMVAAATESMFELAWCDEHHGLLNTAELNYGMLRTVIQAEPFWLPSHITEAVVSSTGLSNDDIAQLKLPYDVVAVHFGTPIDIEGDGLWDPAVAEIDLTPRVRHTPHYRNLAAHKPIYGMAGGVDVWRVAMDPSTQCRGVILLAEDDGSLSDHVLWIIETVAANPNDNNTTPKRCTGIIYGSISRSGLAQVAHNAAAMVCLGPWDLHEIDAQGETRPVADRGDHPTNGQRRAVDPLLRVRVLSTERLQRALAEANGSERTIRSHLRRGHWRRQRVGPRQSWTYRPVWIHPTVVNPGVPETDTKVVCTVQAQLAGSFRQHHDSVVM